MANEPKVTRAPWSDEAARALQAAAGSDRDLERIRAEVRDDRNTQLYQVTGSAEGWLVLRLEGDFLGDIELVIVLGAGHGSTRVIPLIKRYATHLGATVRTHVTRPGLERIYQHNGFYQAETVMRWRPGDGQQVKE